MSTYLTKLTQTRDFLTDQITHLTSVKGCIGTPFGHTGQCDRCKTWVPYNDRIETWMDTKPEEKEVLCFWCVLHADDLGFGLSPDQHERLVTHLIVEAAR